MGFESNDEAIRGGNNHDHLDSLKSLACVCFFLVLCAMILVTKDPFRSLKSLQSYQSHKKVTSVRFLELKLYFFTKVHTLPENAQSLT